MGTIAYLAPEVIQGESPDARSTSLAGARGLRDGGRTAAVRGAAPRPSPASGSACSRLPSGPSRRRHRRTKARWRAGSRRTRTTATRRPLSSTRRSAGRHLLPIIGAATPPVRSRQPVPTPAPRRQPTARVRMAGPPPRRGLSNGAIWAIVAAVAVAVARASPSHRPRRRRRRQRRRTHADVADHHRCADCDPGNAGSANAHGDGREPHGHTYGRADADPDATTPTRTPTPEPSPIHRMSRRRSPQKR